MTEKFFVDTNVLIYARDTSAAKKQKEAIDWLKFLWEKGTGRLSFQVLNEFYYVCTQKLKPGLPIDWARKDVKDLCAWDPIVTDESLIAASLELQDSATISFWDSLIIAAAKLSGCRYLLSEDFSNGQTYSGVMVIDPFQHSHDEFK